MIEAMIHGFILAGGLILPLGVQNLFIFNQGANQRRLIRAMPSVITAALCDNLLVILAVLGVSAAVFTFGWLKMILLSVGIVFLIYMGWQTWKSDQSNSLSAAESNYGLRKQVLFAASVSLLNPHAIMDTIVVIGMNSLQYSGANRATFTLSVILVSWLWFIGLCAAGSLMKKMDKSGDWMRRLNKASAVIIWGTALYMVWRLLD
ncbi:LysE/ArgO family amino acid transporter [Paenibacillus sp. UNC451MF]|uniref:LysE/ArgO family amino acid transporter n=1 Tax=Paenibacillus sp. UNC451MF TaxID=1449063 RepID=UPI00049036BE|nr:LysE/ArgO family amino acid transporter [Paenibacillus sp. UNC451MF]